MWPLSQLLLANSIVLSNPISTCFIQLAITNEEVGSFLALQNSVVHVNQ